MQRCQQPPFKAAKHGRAPAAAAPAPAATPAPAPAAAASKAASQGRAGKGGFSRQAAAAAAPALARSAAAGGRPTAKATAAAAAAGLGSGAQLNSLSECLGQALVARNAQGTSMGPASVAAKTRAALLAVMGVPQPPPGMPGMPIAVLAAHGPGDGGVVGHVASGPLAAAEMELPPPPAAAAAQERGAAGPTTTDRGPEAAAAAAAAATGAAGVGQSGAAGAWWHVLDMACKLMCQQQEPYTTWDHVMDWIWKMDATDRCVRCEVGSVKVLATVQKNHVAPACAVFWTFQKSCFDLKPSRREILHGI